MSGKVTAVLRILGTLERPPSGEVHVAGLSAGYPSLMYFLHGPFCALWNAGDWGMGLRIGNWIFPFESGSGKLGTPFARMQFASRSSWCRTLAGTGGECPDWGKCFSHALNALW